MNQAIQILILRLSCGEEAQIELFNHQHKEHCIRCMEKMEIQMMSQRRAIRRKKTGFVECLAAKDVKAGEVDAMLSASRKKLQGALSAAGFYCWAHQGRGTSRF